jgi:hypothetical protein
MSFILSPFFPLVTYHVLSTVTAGWRMTMNFRKAFVIAVAVVAAFIIIPLARNRSQNVSIGREWAGLFKKHPAFSAKRPGYPVDVSFDYAAPTDDNLRKLRETYDLEVERPQFDPFGEG